MNCLQLATYLKMTIANTCLQLIASIIKVFETTKNTYKLMHRSALINWKIMVDSTCTFATTAL